ncbi:hypothetical protein [Nocardia terpenica]|uniref:Uncharacterized protein n=1 Tax=Nocardia terpenica TaxID=455432 RepID=A0A6G9ZDP9_9NOCA|nr:hypothetical protein [Nocardia terpenica]QIS23668.1 hypothetical protein F6W96_40750 [Nocardia terpenica]
MLAGGVSPQRGGDVVADEVVDLFDLDVFDAECYVRAVFEGDTQGDGAGPEQDEVVGEVVDVEVYR